MKKAAFGRHSVVLIASLLGLLSVQGQVSPPPPSVPVDGPPALELWMAPNAAFWNWSPDEFARESRGNGFRWMEENIASRAAPPIGTFFGKPAMEAVVRFKDASPHSIVCYYFNRGDSDSPLLEDHFKAMVRELIETLTQRLRRQPMPGTNLSPRNDVKDDSRVWQLDTLRFELSYSYTPSRPGRAGTIPFRAEYVHLTVTKSRAGDMPAHAITRVNVFEVRANVTRNQENGDVFIANIPMVDQGEKGYCANATAERVMRYFGQNVDQHQIAQLANTSATRGTNVDQLKNALQTIGRQYTYSMNTHLEWSGKAIDQLVEDYNRVARTRGEREVNIAIAAYYGLGMLFAQMKPDVLVESRQRRKTEVSRFDERIKKYIDGGVPLIWGVVLGIIPEKGIPQNAGGHLRLIIGYNTTKGEIIYTDSWGRGHEMKRMPADQAFAITSGLYSLEPRGLRL